ncbi:response regulator [Bacteroides uniformis]|nr:response regulator [Bacteroides uniformis]
MIRKWPTTPKALLSPVYNVVCRFDADSAFKAMSEEAPDLVLSDVVMPGRNGYDLCRQIKEDLQLCHIPVILVTAKATVENQVEGLNTGADAYVTKPFEPNYLLALIKSQLKNREKVRSLPEPFHPNG